MLRVVTGIGKLTLAGRLQYVMCGYRNRKINLVGRCSMLLMVTGIGKLTLVEQLQYVMCGYRNRKINFSRTVAACYEWLQELEN